MQNRRGDAYEIVARFADSVSGDDLMVESQFGRHLLDPYFFLHESRVVLADQLFRRAFDLVQAFCEEAGWSINDPSASGAYIERR